MASLPRLDGHGLGELFAFSLQGLQTCLADIAIHIEDKDSGTGASGNADVGVRPLVPPSFDGLAPSGGVLDAFGRVRMFACAGTGLSLCAGTLSVVGSEEWQHVPAATGVVEGKFSTR